jgi:hypothetical protein
MMNDPNAKSKNIGFTDQLIVDDQGSQNCWSFSNGQICK